MKDSHIHLKNGHIEAVIMHANISTATQHFDILEVQKVSGKSLFFLSEGFEAKDRNRLISLFNDIKASTESTFEFSPSDYGAYQVSLQGEREIAHLI